MTSTEFVSRETFHPNPGRQGGAWIGQIRVPNVVCHHTPGQDPSSYTEALEELEQIYGTHAGANGWADYGYNLIIWDRFVFEARGLGYVGAHAPGANSISIGIAFLMDGRFRSPSSNERQAFVWAITHAQEYGYLSSTPRVSGHRDWIATTCPGDLAYGTLGGLLLPTQPEPISEETHVYEFSLRPGGVFEWGKPGQPIGHINYADFGGAAAYDFPAAAKDDVVSVGLVTPDVGEVVCSIVYPSGKQSQAGVARWGKPMKFPVEEGETGFVTVLVSANGHGRVRVVGRSS